MGFFDFLKSVPVVSQVISAGQAIAGDNEGARETQERFLNSAIDTALAGGPLGLAIREILDNTVPGAPRLSTSRSLTPRTNWMSATSIQALCLHEILIPGTHDSSTYQFKGFVPDMVAKWARAQTLSIRAQLDGGVRYLDLRVTKSDGVFYGTHTYPTVPLDDIYRAVKEFLVANPHEKVILSTAWEGTGDGELDASKTALADVHFAGRYVRPSSLLRPIGTWDANESVLFLKNRKIFGAEEIGEYLHNSWNGEGNTESTDPVANSEKCVRWAKGHARAVARLNLLAYEATPDGGSIAGSTISGMFVASSVIDHLANNGRIDSLEASAGRSNFLITDQLLKSAEALLGTNVIAMDFANDAVIGAIVGLNPRTLEEAGYTSVGEGASVDVPRSSFVAYGAEGSFKFGVVSPATVAFNNATFGDPCVGAAKRGYYKSTPVALQDSWRWCCDCNALFYQGAGFGRGCCAANAEGHRNSGSGNYTLYHECNDVLGGQGNWRYCNKCASLTWGGSPGVCRAGGGHNHVSNDYHLAFDAAPQAVLRDRGQDQWRYCAKCAGLVYGGFAKIGACPAGGEHDRGATNYRVESV